MAEIFVGDDVGLLKKISLKEGEKSMISKHEETFGVPNRDYKVHALSPFDDKNHLLVCRGSGVVEIFSTEEKNTVKVINVPSTTSRFVGCETFGSRFFTCTDNGAVTFGSLEDDTITSEKLNAGIARMRVCGDGAHVAIGGDGEPLKIFSLENLTEPVFVSKNVKNDRLDLPVPVKIKDLDFVAESHFEVVTTNNNHLRVYDTRAARRPVIDKEISNNPLQRISMLKGKRQLLYTDNMGEIYLGDLKKVGHKIKSFQGARGKVADFQHVECNPNVLASVGTDRFLRIHDFKSGKEVQKVYLKQRLNSVVAASQ